MRGLGLISAAAALLGATSTYRYDSGVLLPVVPRRRGKSKGGKGGTGLRKKQHIRRFTDGYYTQPRDPRHLHPRHLRAAQP